MEEESQLQGFKKFSPNLRFTQVLNIVGIVIVILTIPVTLFLVSQPTKPLTKASTATTLSLTPSSQSILVGNTVSLTVNLDPGPNLISVTKLAISYDGSFLTPGTPSISPNPFAFPVIVDAPSSQCTGNSCTLFISLSIGADPTRAIAQPVTVATINFQAKSVTSNPTQVSFTSATQVLSISPSTQVNQNVLSTTSPAAITIVQLLPTPTQSAPPSTPTSIISGSPPPLPTATSIPSTPTISGVTPTAAFTPTPIISGPTVPQSTPIPTLQPTIPPTVIPTPIPSLTPLPTFPPQPTPTIVPGDTQFSFALFLHNIGNGGDNANPTGRGNQHPLHPQRTLTIFVYDANNNLVTKTQGLITYDPLHFNFIGTIDIGTLATGDYTIKVQTDGYLRKSIPGLQHIIAGGGNNTIPLVTLVGGDIFPDNQLDVQDYNILISCYSSNPAHHPPTSCTPQQQQAADIDDDGVVDIVDYNEFLRELSTQHGD